MAAPLLLPGEKRVEFNLTAAQVENLKRWLPEARELRAVVSRGEAASPDAIKRLWAASMPLIEAVLAGIQ